MLITNKEMEVDTKQTPVLEPVKYKLKSVYRTMLRWCTA